MSQEEMDWEELDSMLNQAFAKATEIYQKRGFQRRIGFGKKPALISVDLANAWTRPGNPFTCDQKKWMKKLSLACNACSRPAESMATLLFM